MKKLTSIVIFGFIGMFLCSNGLAQVSKEKNFDKTYYSKPGGHLELINKYGEIIIRSWNEDSVRVSITATASGRSSDAVKKSLNQIDVSYRKFGEAISVETKLEQSKSFFGNILSEVEDYSKSLFGGTKVTVDYEVWMPENYDLSIENKYGNIFMAKLKGSVSIDLAHGDLKANGLEKELTLKHSFGRGRIDQLYKGDFELKGVELKIDKAKIVDFESSSSEITLGVIDLAQFNSRNDKISIRQVDEIIAEGVFTDLNADMVVSSARLDFNYGDIFITRVNKDFNAIDIIGKSTDINLILDQGSYISAEITADKDRMIVPSSMLVLKKGEMIDVKNVSLSGFVGPTQQKHGDLTIQADGGELIISIQELPLFTNKN